MARPINFLIAVSPFLAQLILWLLQDADEN